MINNEGRKEGRKEDRQTRPRETITEMDTFLLIFFYSFFFIAHGLEWSTATTGSCADSSHPTSQTLHRHCTRCDVVEGKGGKGERGEWKGEGGKGGDLEKGTHMDQKQDAAWLPATRTAPPEPRATSHEPLSCWPHAGWILRAAPAPTDRACRITCMNMPDGHVMYLYLDLDQRCPESHGHHLPG